MSDQTYSKLLSGGWSWYENNSDCECSSPSDISKELTAIRKDISDLKTAISALTIESMTIGGDNQ